jgi:hypothetical protein
MGVILLAVETIFLVGSGISLWTANSTTFPSTPDSRALQRAVGPTLVALGSPQCFFPPGIGIPVNANIYYGVHELAVYDPIVPKDYFTAWAQLPDPKGGVGFAPVSHYCPGVTSATIARQYGVGFILERHGDPAPTGARFETTIGKEDLYRVTGAGPAVVLPASSTGSLPPDSARGTPVAVTSPSPTSWRLHTDSARSQILRLHLTNVPGWHATIDGHPLALEPYSLIMLQARIPPGRHLIELHYLPTTFTAGSALAALAAIGLVVAGVLATLRRRSRSRAGSLSRPKTSE